MTLVELYNFNERKYPMSKKKANKILETVKGQLENKNNQKDNTNSVEGRE